MKLRIPSRLFLAGLLAVAASALAQDKLLVAGEDGVPVPKKTKHVQPEYPPEALAQGIRGIVILDLVVDSTGHVASATVLRGIPGLDDAAVAAAKRWEFEPVEMGGKPVSVRITQGITFALQLPRITRDPGVPELRQGVAPKLPAGAADGGTAAAEVVLESDGRVGSARIVEGAEPWAGALLAALQTWRFGLPPDDATLSFRVQADFVPARGSEPARVLLKAGSLQQTDLLASNARIPAPAAPTSAAPPQAAAPAAPAAAGASPASTPPPSSPAGAQPAQPASPSAASPEPGSTVEPRAAASAAQERHPATPPPGAPAAPGSVPDAGVPPAAPPIPATPGATPGGTPPAVTPAPPPAALPEPPRAQPPSSGISTNVPGTDRTEPPPVEVITAPPPQQPPENGISAIRDITLQPGVPDLTQGRRPVAPPLARMAGASGSVEVQFSVSAAGGTTVQSVAGPDLLKKAAEQAVASWTFRRTRADRAYLVATFSFEGDKASAIVKPQPTPPTAAASADRAAQPAVEASPAADPAAPAVDLPPPVRVAPPRITRPPDNPPTDLPGRVPPTGIPPTDSPNPPGTQP